MTTTLRLLILEDDLYDTELEVALLEEAGYTCQWERVETREEFLSCLDRPDYDVILADYNLPAFDGLTALKLLLEHDLDIPFILVSGTLGEETAIESLKAGATDYVLKTRLSRLRPVVQRALREKEEHRQRQRAEAALRESEAKYRALFANIADPIFILDQQTQRILDCNQAALNRYGYTLEELQAMPVHALHPPRDREILEKSFAGQTYHMTRHYTHTTKQGEQLQVEVHTAALEYEGRKAWITIAHDISERKRLEDQLRQAQKMEAIGTLAGGIAHDFNNILTGILAYASLVRLDLPPNSPLQPDIGAIIDSARRAADLTEQLLTFAHRSTHAEMQPIDLNAVVLEVTKLLERTISKEISIDLHLADDLHTLRGDSGQLHQVLLNLSLNARDAMPRGGRLIIETGNRFIDAEVAHSNLNVVPGDYVVLSVTDTGEGMDLATRERLFEPFFTTKEQGRGLGLAMVYGIVRGHEGTIHVYSEPGQGTTFRVYLPAYSGPAVVPSGRADVISGGSETVLVVDDEEHVRGVLQRMLKRGGYTVLLAEGGPQAVELYRRRGAEIDLVILDVVMPGMGGKEVLGQLREIDPQARVLLSSGYSENSQAAGIAAAEVQGFLQKPYDVDTVLRKVRQALDAA